MTKIEVTVSTQTKLNKSPYYYAVLHWIDPVKKITNKRYNGDYKWITTKIKYVDEKQKRLHKNAEQEANIKAEELRKSWENELNSKILKNGESNIDDRANQKFSDYMREWAEQQRGKKQATTSSTYISNVNGIIAPYFDKTDITLASLDKLHLQNFYNYQYSRILDKGPNKGKPVGKNTVKHYHSAIHKALNDAIVSGIIDHNPDDYTQLEQPDDYVAKYYTETECLELLDKVKGTNLELFINIAVYYGLRRSEILGLKWNAIDFTQNRISIKYKVTEATIDNKRVLVESDKLKSKSAHRSLPLVKSVKKLLKKEKQKQSDNKKLFGNSYKNKKNYIFVYDDGELIKPDTITNSFPNFLINNDLEKIRLHDLRHTCASLLLANGISMKEIQMWLGHSSFNTTAKTYAHLDDSFKCNSANVISNILDGSNNTKQ